MDLQCLFSVIIVFASLSFFVIRFRSSKSIDKSNKVPPQPWKLPLIGHIHHFLGEAPHRPLARLAEKLGPIMSLQLGETFIIVISSPSLAKEVMKTHDLHFVDRSKLLSFEIVGYNYKNVALTAYGEYWRVMRKICIINLLSSKKVLSFCPIRERESWNLVESIAMERSNTINLSENLSILMNVIICKVAVGGKCKDLMKLRSLIQEIIYLSGGFDVDDIFPSIKAMNVITGKRNKLMKIRAGLDEVFDDVIAKHQQSCSGDEQNDCESEDLLDVLLRFKDEGGLNFQLTSDHIKAVFLDIFLAGTDTSSATIAWAMSELMKNPTVMKKVQSELRTKLEGKKKIYESDIQGLEYPELVIMETLRLHPPLPLIIPRKCRENCEIGGYDIPVNTKVIINAWKMGRDPDYWTDPESFIPERFSKSLITMMGNSFEYLPFGAGRRMCPGISLGLANIELVLVMLLYHFNWDLPNGAGLQDLDMSESFTGNLKRKNPLFLVSTPYCVE